MRETLIVVTVGLAIGAIVAAITVKVSSSFIEDLLFGITATNLRNFVAAIGIIIAVALLACILPALRTTCIDPLTVLRED